MKVNWKVRFKNKVWLGMFLSLIVGFVFNMLKLFDVVPVVTENTIINIINQVLTFLGLIGVIVDPTTAGLEDSNRAMSYEEPWQDEPEEPAETEESDKEE
ncbi:MAG: phage holin [Clostridia bacterium]|nr:phage holin [Clostridia bacterium]